jgi:D-alanyl-D-alanine carboxypeptidase/D-alanyl-D-alanine-endopeptidase (penicillin-binding protein 4)
LVLNGTVSKRAKLQSVSIPEPLLFSATAMREHLAARGITVAGKLRFERVRTPAGNVPSDCVIIAEESTPLSDVLGRIGINSQNMFAEALLKRVGYEWSHGRGHRPAIGSWENGRQAVGAFLARTGCDPATVVISDGSGLSRANRVSAADLVRVLRHMHAGPDRELFVTSLAGNRTGGTLQKRMKSVAGEVYAKTGYMRGIRTLSGYVRALDGRWYAFSVLFNGFKGSSAPYNRIHDQVCRILARSTGDSPP